MMEAEARARVAAAGYRPVRDYHDGLWRARTIRRPEYLREPGCRTLGELADSLDPWWTKVLRMLRKTCLVTVSSLVFLLWNSHVLGKVLAVVSCDIETFEEPIQFLIQDDGNHLVVGNNGASAVEMYCGGVPIFELSSNGVPTNEVGIGQACSFIEKVPGRGVVQLLTMDPSFSAVYSRHTILLGSLVPSQSKGHCSVSLGE